MLNGSYKVSEEYVSRRNHDGTVVLMRMDDSDLFYKIDGVAADVWKCIEDKKNFDSLINDTAAQFGVSKDCVEKDVADFLQVLLSRNMILKN